ncbi:hypothetical protein Glove_471g4 [Diversispora epigaea]|uniref:MULE transposase domain-containing protein n=1 Tax=Diversispora epigaea TaxID=1348612 RepID=A0A397GUJ1_9GLOM|nr:hypothetical protein Glove_471g4 [Diversispora epigaea]
MTWYNFNEEITLPSNDETILPSINDKAQPNNNNNSETTLPDNIVPFVGQVFETWDDVDKYLHEYAWQEKFIVIKTRNNRDPSLEQTCRRRTYACNHQGTYKPKKTVILENQRNSKSKRTGCPWHVNINFPKKTAIINITSLNINHNHQLDPMTNVYTTKNRTLPEAVVQEICFYTAEGNLGVTIQPDRQENDASKFLRQLLTKKTEEPRWEVFWEINQETKSLDKVFWISAEQVQLWITYHDVILNDNTHKTNQFNMLLSLFTVYVLPKSQIIWDLGRQNAQITTVDNHFCTRLVAQVLVNDETKKTYEWLLTFTLQATNHAPRVFITDSDPGMDAAIDSQYSNASLGITYNDFVKDFFLCRNDLSLTGFDIQWNKLITTYPKAANYLNSELYSSKERWATSGNFNRPVDNHFCTRLVAQVLVNDETKKTYEWLLTFTLQATNHAPRVFITDSDPGMDAAIDSQYSNASLGITYNDFVKDFFLCRNDLSLTGFDIQWNKLITTYPKAANYLNSELYSSKERWATSGNFNRRKFTEI